MSKFINNENFYRCGLHGIITSAQISDMVNTVIADIQVAEDKSFIAFKTANEIVYMLFYEQVCGESVFPSEIVGDLKYLIDSPILLAEESTKLAYDYDFNPGDDYSCINGSWACYKLVTIKGYVDLRFYGQSNDNFFEGVDIVKFNLTEFNEKTAND